MAAVSKKTATKWKTWPAGLNINCVTQCFLRSEDNRYLGRIGCDMEREQKLSFYFIISQLSLFAMLNLLVYCETQHSNQNTHSDWSKRELRELTNVIIYCDIPPCQVSWGYLKSYTAEKQCLISGTQVFKIYATRLREIDKAGRTIPRKFTQKLSN